MDRIRQHINGWVLTGMATVCVAVYLGHGLWDALLLAVDYQVSIFTIFLYGKVK